ncbi:MAG TPA: dynamin family protein [Pseudomonadales bacterium]|nr:dynamin family protein [Pseudomonadales bacterium]
MPVSDLQQLVRLTRELEEAVPALHGAFPDFEELAARIDGAQRRRSVYLLGTIKSGKSTLVNALLARDVMPRGAGVKTFNLTRATRREATRATIRFRSGAQLRAQLAFDFRMLGFTAALPQDPWSEAGVASLQRTLQAFEAACRDDERLQGVEADASILGLLPLSLARVRRTIAGLAEVHRREPAAVVATIASDALLTYDGDAFDDYRTWTASVDVAALIREIELGLPFPAQLPASLELVDCQGSDSLNPLDFADVESVVQSADLVVYVIQSRLGLRQGDRMLLRHLADGGAADRLVAVLNVEAYDAMARADFDVLRDRVADDVVRNAGHPVPLLVLNSLHDLQAGLGDEEETVLMRRLWEKRGAGEVFEELLEGSLTLRQRLRTLAESGGEGTPEAVLAGLRHRARSVAEGLLARDRRVLGTDSGGMAKDALEQAVQRIIDGERLRVRADLAGATDAAFAAEGELQRELDAWLAQGAARYVRQRPVPEALLAETRPAQIIDAALAAFNDDWLHAPGTLRAANLGALRQAARTRLLEGVAHVVEMLPDEPGMRLEDGLGAAGADSAEGDGPPVRSDPERRLDEVIGRFAVPQLLSPVVLPRTLRHGLGAEFVSRGLIGRIGRAREPGEVDDQLAQRVEKLWRRTLQALFRQAADDRTHGLPSVRENLKFQFFYRIGDALLDALGDELVADVRAHHAALAKLAADDRLLLRGSARVRVQAFADAL